MMQQAAGSDRPRFRQEQLVAEPIEDRGGRFIDVMDPDSGNLFRFYEVEFSLACAMDGERDVAGIVQWAKEELGVAPSQNEVRSVIATLGELGYLDQTAAAKAAAAASAPRAPAREQDLAAGIVVGTPARKGAPAVDVELGHAGTAKAPAAQELPKAPDLALGAAGATAAKTPQVPAEEVALGASGPTTATEVSLDLSDHIAVRPDDVKEAVRASKVMAAVDVPKDLLDALEEPKPAKPPVAQPAVVAKAIEKPVEPAIAKAVDKPAIVAKPVEKPAIVTKPVERPVTNAAEKLPVAPTARRVSPVLVVLLILALGGLAAYMAWKYLLKDSNKDETKTGLVQQPVVPPVAPVVTEEPPVKPSEPVVKLAMDTPATVEVKAEIAGTVEAIEPAKSVNRGAIVAKLVGHRPLATEIAVITKDIARVAPQVTKLENDLVIAQGTNDATKIKTAEKLLEERKKSLADKQDALAKKTSMLEKHFLKAPTDGDLKPVAKQGAKVLENAIVFSISPAPVLVATFKSDGAPAAGSSVFVAVKGNETKLTCKVTQVDADGAKVVCPSDPTLDGVEVTLGGPAPTEPPPPEPPPIAPVIEQPALPPPQPKRVVPPQPKRVVPKVDPKPVDPKPVDPPADPKPDPKPADPKPEGSGATPP